MRYVASRLVSDIEALSGGRVRLSTGTLYGALRRLLEDAWIERFEHARKTSLQAHGDGVTRAARARLRTKEA